jgi:hypothetical protein
MEQVQKSSNSECDTPSSEPFRTYKITGVPVEIRTGHLERYRYANPLSLVRVRHAQPQEAWGFQTRAAEFWFSELKTNFIIWNENLVACTTEMFSSVDFKRGRLPDKHTVALWEPSQHFL